MGDLLARLRALTGRQRLLAGAGVAAAAGLGLLASRRAKKAGGGVDTGQASASAGSDSEQLYTPPGTYPNSYGTDVASAVGDLDSRYAESLAEFTDQLGSSAEALAAMQATQGTSLAEMNARIAGLTRPAVAPQPATVARKTKAQAKGAATKRTWRSYTVKKGDSLGAIAKHYNTTVGKLSAQNNISNPKLIVAGTRIKVPMG